MLIWGTKGREITESTGRFDCPNCNTSKEYQLKRIGKYFTLYFIPIFQYKIIQKYVRCSGCGSDWEENIILSKPLQDQENPEKTSQDKNHTQEIIEEHSDAFHTASEMAFLHIMAVTALQSGKIDKFDQTQVASYNAFKLGVLNWHFDLMLESLFCSDLKKMQGYSAFMLYYVSASPDETTETFEFWMNIVTQNSYANERHCGYLSVNDGINEDGSRKEGFYGISHFETAVRLAA